MKKKIFPFYDLVVYLTICALSIGATIAIMLVMISKGEIPFLSDNSTTLIFFIALSFGICAFGRILLKYCTIDTEKVFFFYFPWTTSWAKAADNIDRNWNQLTNLSEIESFEIVKLTNEEKETYVFYKHWFNKYLKISLKNGTCKYVYVGCYTDKQIRIIIAIININQRALCETESSE